jgi:hypothetical protein
MLEGNIASHQSDEDILAKHECDEDRIHTDACEAKLKRKSRIQYREYASKGKTKMYSNEDTVAVSNKRGKEEIGETRGEDEINMS